MFTLRRVRRSTLAHTACSSRANIPKCASPTSPPAARRCANSKRRTKKHFLMTTKLTGKRALVTAGAQGIGLAISRQLLAAGCDVFVHYHRSADGAKALAAEAAALGRRCASASADLTSTEGCNPLV